MLLLVLVSFTGALPAADGRPPERVSVGAATNLVYALDGLHEAFRAQEPDVVLTVATGASGNLVAQIVHGAPYDVFLSADVDYPRALVASGHADAGSLTVFATGRLVLWATRPDLMLGPLPALATNPAVRKIAIANLDSAPYGRAAKQALERSGVWTSVAPRIVYGETVTQTAQFVETGSADVGFVALSLVLSPRLQGRGHWEQIDPELYAPLDQAAVLTRRGRGNSAAARYLAFLGSAAAREVLERFGYDAPKPSAAKAPAAEASATAEESATVR